MQLHAQSQFEEAARLYREVLAADANHARANHFLGVLLHQRGENIEAERLLRRSIELRPDSAPFHNNFGDMLRTLGRTAESLAMFLRSAELEPKNPIPPLNIGMLLAMRQKVQETIPWLRKTLALKPDQPQATFLLGQALISFPESANEGIALLEKCVRWMPEDANLKFVLAAARGEAPPTAPAQLVQGIFDGYAETFEQHLVEELNYRGPELLRASVDRVTGGSKRRIDVLDLGCGTGLVGESFRDIAKTLIGVDLSPQMIEKARQKDLYDELEVGDAVAALQSRANRLDLIVAGDTLIYIGELSALFAAAAAALRAGGLFSFTVETFDGSTFRLTPARRYEHSHIYLRDVATKNGFAIALSEQVVIRRELGNEVPSSVYVLRRN